jgi:tetratricopeptide (TPR) repeat protein
MRIIIAFAVCLGMATGCSGLYSGKPEKVKRPKTEKMPDEPVAGPAEIKWVPECKASFQEEPAGMIAKHKKNEGKVRPQIDQGVALLEQAAATDITDDQKAGNVKQAINVLRRVLDDAPYSPRATYNLAVAYARARRKDCSKALLKRLAALEKYPDFQAEAKRMIDTAQEDSTLKLFEKEMLEALGK